MPNQFLTARDLRTEPGRSRFSLLVCLLAITTLSGLSTWAHTEPKIVAVIQLDQVQVTRAASRSIRTGATKLRTAQATGSQIIGKLGRLVRRTR